MDHSSREKRRHERFDTNKEIFFTVSYEIKTKVNFQIIDQKSDKILAPKYLAVSRNVSAEGICFTSLRKLKLGDVLILEVYALESKDPVYMEGEVKWSNPTSANPADEGKFDAGVRIVTVEGRSLTQTFVQDASHKVVWSAVLESVLGSFEKK